jgi:hypothetical protein
MNYLWNSSNSVVLFITNSYFPSIFYIAMKFLVNIPIFNIFLRIQPNFYIFQLDIVFLKIYNWTLKVGFKSKNIQIKQEMGDLSWNICEISLIHGFLYYYYFRPEITVSDFSRFTLMYTRLTCI